MVHVVIDNGHPGKPPSARVRRANRHVVEEAKAHRAVTFRMVARRAHHREGAGTSSRIEDVIDAGHRRTGRQERSVVGVGRRKGVRIKCDRTAGGFPEQAEIGPAVNPRELLVRSGTRLDHCTATPSELRHDDLHDFGTLDAFRMARWGQVIGKAIGGKDGQRQGPLSGVSRHAQPRQGESAARSSSRSSAPITSRLPVAR